MPYPSFRTPVYARGGMVATSQPLAAQAGLSLLRAGGNAADAAIASAAALTVLEPTSNGLGGDAFALVWDGAELHGLNASGAAPAALTRERLEGQPMPHFGWRPVTVPGAVRGWADLHARFGRRPLGEVLAPAIHYARAGYPLSPVVAAHWARADQIYRALDLPELAEWFRVFMPPGFTPRPGAVWASEAHARTLEAIARSGGEDLYSGSLARAISGHAEATGGLLRDHDLAAHQSEWVTPLRTRYRDGEVAELPPNGQGLAALIALGILDGLTLPPQRDSAEGLHLQIEAMKLGFADAQAHVADTRHAEVPLARLLSEGHFAAQRGRISQRALDPATPAPDGGGTVYLCAADGEGQMVSFIQSNYLGFGSGVVVPGSGIALHNRGLGFHADPAHPNALAPGKRPYHTIIPGFLFRGGEPLGPFGVMGGFMQPQGHVQVVVNTLDYGMDPQSALDAPRWQWLAGRTVEVEHELGAGLSRALLDLGHDLRVQLNPSAFGRGQIIWRDPATGVLVGGSEPRADGLVAAY